VQDSVRLQRQPTAEGVAGLRADRPTPWWSARGGDHDPVPVEHRRGQPGEPGATGGLVDRSGEAMRGQGGREHQVWHRRRAGAAPARTDRHGDAGQRVAGIAVSRPRQGPGGRAPAAEDGADQGSEVRRRGGGAGLVRARADSAQRVPARVGERDGGAAERDRQGPHLPLGRRPVAEAHRRRAAERGQPGLQAVELAVQHEGQEPGLRAEVALGLGPDRLLRPQHHRRGQQAEGKRHDRDEEDEPDLEAAGPIRWPRHRHPQWNHVGGILA
jgi:hypothetical protein